MFHVGKKRSFNGLYLRILPLGGNPRQHPVSIDKQAIVNDGFQIQLSTEAHCVITFSGSALPVQPIDFHGGPL
jgi:hypothetical protein